MKNSLFAAALGVALTSTTAVNAAPMNLVDLTTSNGVAANTLIGNVETDAWKPLNMLQYPTHGTGGFPGTTPWSAPIQSENAVSANAAELYKVSNGPGNAGGPYFASGSIYYGGFSAVANFGGGTLGVRDATPIANLAQIAFQVQIGEAWGFDFVGIANEIRDENDVVIQAGSATSGAPKLYINGDATTGTLVAPATADPLLLEAYYNGTVPMPTGDEDVFINTYLFQWDLTGITDPITSFEIDFTGVQHAQLYQIQLAQSDTFNLITLDSLATVPEPSTWALTGCGAMGVGLLMMRRRKSAATV